MAQELVDALNLTEIRFIPSANPPHKAVPKVSAQQRAKIVELAIADNPVFRLDTRELDRQGASYTIDTLISLREEIGKDVSLCLIMGSDAFTKLDTWQRWDELLDHCHIILVQRPSKQVQSKLSEQLTAFLESHYTENADDLAEKPAGYVHMQHITAQDIAATSIREQLLARKNVKYLVPDQVLAYIQQQQLYK